jgi:hypothetical protein
MQAVQQPVQQGRAVTHPQLGGGTLLRTYMSGFEWEVLFDSGRRFRLPAREFEDGAAIARAARGAVVNAPAPRAPVLELDQFRARQTLEALRLGIVPVQDAETLTIGLEAERVSLDRALARSKERGGDVQAVIGDYGFGKSHFVELAARRALRENFLVANASLDLVEAPPGKAREIYRALARSVRYPDTDERGLQPLLKRAVDHSGLPAAMLERSPIPGYDPLALALRALADCPSQVAYDDVVAWLGAQARPTAEMRACFKKPPTLWTTGEVARQYIYILTGFSVLATELGYSGLAVLIDESEHYSLLRAAQRGRADAFFKGMIYAAVGNANGKVDPRSIPDHARVEYPITFATDPHLFFLFALTESANRMPVDLWLAPAQIIRLDDRFIERDIRVFFETLLRYHTLAFGYAAAPDRYNEVSASAPGLLSRTLAEHRVNLREVIRTAVTLCDLLYLHADYSPEAVLGELRKGLRL